MSFRIGITIGDVVERDGDLLGDGVNIAARLEGLAADAREDVAHQLAEASSGWNAVAVGSSGRPGLALKASNEQDAVNGALSDCTERDSNCRVIAIGPLEVGPN